MKPFLKYVAEDLLKKNGNDLSRTVVVFPNKRAGLFFNDYLAECSGQPIWAPRYMSISELFSSISTLKPADPIEAVCRLFRIYTEETGNTETLDFFYGWGEKLLADFDDVDKNMTDAARLFRNLKDIRQLEADGFIDEKQEKVLQSFFRDFSLEETSRIRRKFLELWNRLLPIYSRLNAELAAAGLAYEGALCRDVVERLESDRLTTDSNTERYALVGFNVLTEVEKRLFMHLRKNGKACFYWDYDIFYAGKGTRNEAGVFLRKNLEMFPNELPASCFDNLCLEKEIEFVSAPTEKIQAQSVTSWLRDNLTDDEKRTAVVLCNEKLLQPVIHALPHEVKEANITKGFPLSHMPVYALMEKRIAQFETKDTADGRRSPRELLETLMETIRTEAQKASPAAGTADIFTEAATEAAFRVYTILNRLYRLAEEGWLEVSSGTLCRLLRQVMRQTSIPFHGEPAVGLQVMGVLETRCLDFENLLVLSLNEGNLPEKANNNSFIPYNLRREFNLTTTRHKTAVYAYNFYRLIQRARRIRLVYNNSTEGLSKGEMSRFMTQLLVETNLPVRHLSLTAQQGVLHRTPPIIKKPDNLVACLQSLSPSAINTYLRCQVQFYFQRVERLKEPDADPGLIEPNTFGSIFHKAAELLYKEKLTERNGAITGAALRPYVEKGGDALLLSFVRRAFAEEHVKMNVIVEEVVKVYLRQLVRNDLRLVPFEVKDMEMETELPLEIPLGQETVTVLLKGNIDRLDVVEADGLTRLRVVDYKTGGNPETANDMEQLFTPAEKHPHYILQTFLYALTLADKARYPIAPALFFVHKAAGEDYSPYITFGKEQILDFQRIAGEFKQRLTELIADILSPDRPFVPTTCEKFCRTCPYFSLCHQ